MPARKRTNETVLGRVRDSLVAVGREASPKNVHFFRTSCRRLRAYAELVEGDAERVLRKLSKRLDKARRLAGRVRDLDVLRDLLRDLQVETEREDRRRLARELEERRARAQRKLTRLLEEKTLAQVRRRWPKVRRAATTAGRQREELRERAWSKAQELTAALPQLFPSLDPGNLHPLRLACKDIRYTAEHALPTEGAKRLAEKMKEVQDAIGRWHDWVVLRERARDLLPAESVLIRVLRSHERASLSDALRRGRALVRPHIAHSEAPALPLGPRKEPGSSGPPVANVS